MDSVFSRSTQPDNLPDETLAALLKAADRATPGPWRAGENGLYPRSVIAQGSVDTYVGPVWGAIIRCEPTTDSDFEHRVWTAAGTPQANAEYIALCDPDTIRSLVTELAVLRKLHRG